MISKHYKWDEVIFTICGVRIDNVKSVSFTLNGLNVTVKASRIEYNAPYRSTPTPDFLSRHINALKTTIKSKKSLPPSQL